jgi:RND family efflux transporter MFP subunit
MKKYILITIITGVGSFLWISCGSKAAKPQKPTAVAVGVSSVKLQGVNYFDEYPGTVTALNMVNITPQVTGYITGVYFKDGQHVEKGQLLYTMDKQQYQANVEMANANYKAAEAYLVQTQQDADRYVFLQQRDAVARMTVDHALATLQTAKMQLAAAKATIQNQQTGLKYTNIYAPLSGTIGISQVKPGASVTPGMTWLNTISSDDPIAVDFYVDEKDISQFEKLQQLPINKTDSTFMIGLPNGELYPFDGQITLLGRTIETQTGTIVTRILFKNGLNVLKTGMNCTVRVRGSSTQPQLLIPFKAVTQQLGESFVFVVSSDTVRQQRITTGRQIGSNVIVNEGLQPGEIVVTEGTAKLKSGNSVTMTSKKSG